MGLEILKKKLNTYRTNTGKLTRVPDELAYEILLSWEEWTGPANKFYLALGADHRKMASLIGRAKKLKREGVFVESDFKEIKLATASESRVVSEFSEAGITIKWGDDRLIKFSQVSQLVEFLDIMETRQAA